MKLAKKVIETINSDFKESERSKVTKQLASITTAQTMDSEYNLINAQMAILKLADGDLEDLIDLTKAAKQDFRDVIYWTTLPPKDK